MSTTVIVPWNPTNIERERAWSWVRSFLVSRHPDWQIIEAIAGGHPWSKSEAIMRAVHACDAEVVVLHDADSFTDSLADAVEAARCAPWVVPHWKVHRLSERATDALLAGEPWSMDDCASRPYRGLAGGGIVVVRREQLLQIPFDPRFRGWGGEDASWGHAANLLLGSPERLRAPLVHLWHPPADRYADDNLNNGTMQLRYLDARTPAKVQTLVDEARDALSALGISV